MEIVCLALVTTVGQFLSNHKIYTVRLNLLTLAGCYLVLVDWLSNLGFILWNFIDLTMQFTLSGAAVKLHGIYPSVKVLKKVRR